MLDKSKFKFKTQVRVRNYEIDWQGVVHNANYLLYFEVGRAAYLEHVGVKIDVNSIQHESKVVVVRNEIDYRSAARFDDLLDVYTRISYIRNTSFAFEGIIEHAVRKAPIAENISFHVWLDHRNNRPMQVPHEFRSVIQKFEGNNALITVPATLV
ncbi:MAG: putative thioesterase [Bacteroidetes bacterium]|nr:putative thioesterase [Bacteroidota bacterium]